MTEADRTTLFMKWAKVHLKETFVFEAKICKEKSLPFKAVKPHQVAGLRRANMDIFNYKIGDHGFDQKPFDGFQMYKVNAYVVVFWYTHPGDRRFSLIPINVWTAEEAFSSRESLTFERAFEIAPVLSL